MHMGNLSLFPLTLAKRGDILPGECIEGPGLPWDLDGQQAIHDHLEVSTVLGAVD